jgi:hypothetical protein
MDTLFPEESRDLFSVTLREINSLEKFMKFYVRMILVISMVQFFGCAKLPPQLNIDEISSIKTIKVVNNFPEYPAYEVIGTTMFNNAYSEVEDPSFRLLITETMIDILKEKGYLVEEVDDATAADADLIIRLESGYDIFASEPEKFKNGYGFYERSFFGDSLMGISWTKKGDRFILLHISDAYEYK